MTEKTFNLSHVCITLNFLTGLSVWIVATSILLKKEPPVWNDEVIFADMSKNLRESGKLKTGLFGNDLSGLHEHALWYQPLYFHILSNWTRIAGDSVESLRLLSVLSAFFSLLTIYLITRLIFRNNVYPFLVLLLVS